jgi:hypothetical protein
MMTFTPVDKLEYLQDTAWRNAMAALYNVVPGTRISDLSMGGPVFMDALGYLFVNIFGDYWQSVTGTAGSATTLAANYTAGGTTISVNASTGLGANATFAVGTLGSTAEEVRTAVGSPSGGGPFTITLSSPMYQNHLSGAAVTPYSPVTSYTHNFALLNSGTGAGGWTAAQPPTMTFTDFTGVPASTGARQYGFACLSEMTLTGDPSKLLEWDAKATALASAIAGSTPTANPSTVSTQASWNSTVTVGGTQNFTNSMWKLTLSRKVAPFFSNAGQQDPFAITRGAMSATVALDWDPVPNEAEFLRYLNNTQPTLSIVATGPSGTSLTITANQAAYTTGEIVDSKDAFGFNTTADLVSNTTNVGPSGGYGPCVISIVNSTVSY